MTKTGSGDKEPKVVESDFLIIGSGLAGLYAALYASNFGTVSILTKSTIEESNSYWAQGGIAAAVDPQDSTYFHMEDTVRAGKGLSDLTAVDVLVKEGRERVMELISLGMQFDSGEAGLELGLEGGHTRRRVLHAGGSATGREMVRFLISSVEANPRIREFENTGVVEIFSESGVCTGALALDGRYVPLLFAAKAIILCSGGASALYERTTNPTGSVGEGIELAYRAGAQITDMEFVQFHPTAFYNKSGGSFLISEALRGEGAYLLDFSGKRFMSEYSELAELAPRDLVSRAIFNEMKKSGKDHVFLDMRHMDTRFLKSRFPNIYDLCMRSGFDISSDPVPVAPAAHYTIGGVKTDIDGGTNLKGLYACGEVACTGVHGANRLASNSLLECIVFARRSVDGASEYIKDPGVSIKLSGGVGEKAGRAVCSAGDEKLYVEIRNQNARMMNLHVGIIRTREGLERAGSESRASLDSISGVSGYYIDKLRMLLRVSELIAFSALLREETRGAHIREDFPEENPLWKSHIVLQDRREPRIVPAD